MKREGERVYVSSDSEEHYNHIMLSVTDLKNRVNILNGQIINLEERLKPVTVAPHIVKTIEDISELGEPVSPIELQIAEIEAMANIISANIESIMQNLRL